MNEVLGGCTFMGSRLRREVSRRDRRGWIISSRATISEMTRFDGAPPHETLGVGGIVGNQSARKLASVFTFHDDGIAALKLPVYFFTPTGRRLLPPRSARSRLHR